MMRGRRRGEQQGGGGFGKGVGAGMGGGVGTGVGVEHAAAEVCQYEYENYKHLVHVKWADRGVRVDGGGE